jgi:hypothetical protein
MPDYSQGKIYRLTCVNLDLVYYGSTVITLKQRLAKHKSDYNRWKSGKSTCYCASSELFEAGDVEIELVIDCPCENKRELEEVEQTFIENDDCCNMKRAYWSNENKKDYMKEYNKDYREKNIDYIKQYGKEYRENEDSKEIQKEYMKKYYEKRKAYYQTEEYKVKRKAYRQKNKIKSIE